MCVEKHRPQHTPCHQSTQSAILVCVGFLKKHRSLGCLDLQIYPSVLKQTERTASENRIPNIIAQKGHFISVDYCSYLMGFFVQ